MLLRIAVLGLMGAALTGFGFVAWISLTPPPPAPVEQAQVPPAPAPAPPAKRRVLAAARAVQPGALLQPGDLAAVEMPDAEAPGAARPDTPQARAELVGAMARRALVEGQPVLPPDVLRPGEHGFLAAVLAPGMRAVSVGVDTIGGVAGLIWPGDRVDVVLAQQFEDTALPPGRRVLGETVLSDLRVVAVDQSLVQGATPSQGPKGAGVSDGGADTGHVVTLEATPQQVERVIVAGRLGKLSLAVRAANEPAEPDADERPITAALRRPPPAGVPVPPAAAAGDAGRAGAKTGPAKTAVRPVIASSLPAGSAASPASPRDEGRGGVHDRDAVRPAAVWARPPRANPGPVQAKADPETGDVAAPQASPASAAPRQALPATTWGADVSPGLGERSAGTSATLRLFQGSAEGKEFKFP